MREVVTVLFTHLQVEREGLEAVLVDVGGRRAVEREQELESDVSEKQSQREREMHGERCKCTEREENHMTIFKSLIFNFEW